MTTDNQNHRRKGDHSIIRLSAALKPVVAEPRREDVYWFEQKRQSGVTPKDREALRLLRQRGGRERV